MNSITEKRCTKCGEVKSLSMFGKMKIGKNGLMPHCKECDKKKSQKWQTENHEKSNNIKRRWYEKNIDKSRKAVNKYRAKNAPAQILRNHIRRVFLAGSTGKYTELERRD